MNINELTIGQIREIQALTMVGENKDSHPYKIGKNYLIRTVTMVQVGVLTAVYKDELVLENASWVADTGRFHEAFSKGLESSSQSEIEVFPSGCEVIVGRGAIIDVCEYRHELPKVSK